LVLDAKQRFAQPPKSLPGDRTIDGAGFLPALGDRSIARTKPLYWQYNLAGSQVKVALRDGNWKILARLQPAYPRAGADTTAEQMKILKSAQLTDFELYDLHNDIGESTNLVQTAPDRFATLKEKLVSYYRAVRSENPIWPPWKSPRYEAGRIQWPEYKPLRRPPK
jgi:arylsulfatase A